MGGESSEEEERVGEETGIRLGMGLGGDWGGGSETGKWTWEKKKFCLVPEADRKRCTRECRSVPLLRV